ncbi:hypothetical protein F2P81_009626 [Scophthalmus maximus]|uniref:NADP-dependent oxidoreductase domain-containing protein n=1 Tax=Scophthalmus maximus TaxID=52904 RepID=A0A6A4TAG2_SCOMX|nr:hypothetical protein F2P81_009626 [Scophthalmus maximus]
MAALSSSDGSAGNRRRGDGGTALGRPLALLVLLRWAVQQDVPVLPKSSNADRIKENARLFDFTLSDMDMDRLSALDCGHKYCWDPSEVV